MAEKAKSSGVVRRALLMMAVIHQAYEQYARPRWPIVLPRPYRMTQVFAGKAYSGEQSPLAFLAESEREAVLAFRGTIRTDEWVSDGVVRQIACPFAPRMGLVHEGFADIYESMRAKIKEAFADVAPAKTLYITGHSLGGALAVLAAADLASGGRRPVVYTFGAPRAGDPRFVWRYGALISESYRIVNRCDLVPRLPPPVWWSPATNAFYFYRHVPRAIRVEFGSSRSPGSHSLRGYFRALALRDPAYAASLGAIFDEEEDRRPRA